MTITVRTSRKGRHIVETDGCFDGTTIQGAIVAKVSLPASIQLQEDDLGWYGSTPWSDEHFTIWHLLEEAKSHNLPGARVLQFRRIQ